MKKQISWVWIIIAFIVFWPLGVGLLLYRLSNDRAATFKSDKTLKYIYWGMFIIGGLLIISDGGAGSFVWGVALIAGGYFVLQTAKKTKIRAERSKQYVEIIVNQQQTYIPSIAASVGISETQVTEELNDMINRGFFVGATIDKATNQIILRSHNVNMQANNDLVSDFVDAAKKAIAGGTIGTAQQPELPKERVVACQNCGGNNVVIGAVGECDYCGEPLQ